MYYVGIDVANKASAICVIDERGKVVRRCEVATEVVDLREALSGLGKARVVIESCPLAEWLAEVVEDGGHEAVIIDARAAKHLVSAKKKTDARDAHTLAQLARTGWYHEVHRKSPEMRLLRSQLQARQGLLRTRKAVNSQVRGLLRAHGVRLGHVSAGAFAERARELTRERVPGLLPYLEPLLALYERARVEARQLKKALAQTARREAVSAQLQSTPSIGPLVSLSYMATIDDPWRFERGEQVADYAGLSPRVSQSGESCYRGRITKDGDALLRWHLVEAAHVLLSHGRDCRLKRWGLALQRRKGAGKARVAVARKLAVLLWKLWITGERFEDRLEPRAA